uniref:RxLR effector protein n=1 Tax=Peronospora matthiolae TaxID=2874970 RepID=A0AAV1TBB8_9STRA
MHTYCILLLILVATIHVSGTAASSHNRPESDLIHDVAPVKSGAALGAGDDNLLRRLNVPPQKTDEERMFGFTRFFESIKRFGPHKTSSRLEKIASMHRAEMAALKQRMRNMENAKGKRYTGY